MIEADVRVFPDLDHLSEAWTRAMADRVSRAVRARGTSSIVLSGGQTPRTLYRRLAAGHRHDVPWAQVHIFWGDERYVAPDDERSNYRMARDTLLDHLPVPASNVHPMPTDRAGASDAAAAYERVLRAHFGTPWPRFDVVLLGLGDDGHTASLFPHSPALDEDRRWVVAVTGPSEPRLRLTLTLPAITGATAIDVIAVGERKAEALRLALAEGADVRRSPAAAVKRTAGALVWWVDAAAAARMGPSAGADRAEG